MLEILTTSDSCAQIQGGVRDETSDYLISECSRLQASLSCSLFSCLAFCVFSPSLSLFTIRPRVEKNHAALLIRSLGSTVNTAITRLYTHTRQCQLHDEP